MLTNERLQYLVYIGLWLGVAGLTGILSIRDNLFFQRFFGGINPLVAMVVIGLLGLVLLDVFLSRGWFDIYRTWNVGWLIIPFCLAALFALVIILVDIKVGFPKEMNVPFPRSLLFYPAIGFVVEIVFHVLPLSLLLIVLTNLSKTTNFDSLIWPCLIVVALLEPIYQTIMGSQMPVWATVYVFLHVFLFNMLELVIFKRYDFVSMYAFRMMYYLFWHILWGYARLKLLF